MGWLLIGIAIVLLVIGALAVFRPSWLEKAVGFILLAGGVVAGWIGYGAPGT